MAALPALTDSIKCTNQTECVGKGRSTSLMATLTLAPHVESFGTSKFKRSLSSNGPPGLPAKRLARPTAELSSPSQFPSTTARPDQRVNVRVPVTRACHSRLIPGQVAFVNRHFGKYHPGPLPSGGLTPIVSMEELNDMLSIESNHITLGGPAVVLNRLFKFVDAKSMHRPLLLDGKLAYRALSSYVFNADVVPDSQHPLHQFALDGLVATRVEEIDDLNTYSTASAQRVCTVAVKGHSSMCLVAETNSIRDARRLPPDPAEHFYLEPIRVLAKVFVVLVAVLVDKSKQRWMFQYEVVSSSNLDVNPLFATGHKLYRKNLRELPSSAVEGDRLTLRVVKLGSVVDTRFGAADDRKLTICVNIAPYEPTEIIRMDVPDEANLTRTVEASIRVPIAIFRAFASPANPRIGKAAGVGLGASTGLRRLKSGHRPSTGTGAAELAVLKQSISDMHLILTTLISEVQGARKAQRDAINDIEGRFTELSQESKRRSDALAEGIEGVQQAQRAQVEKEDTLILDIDGLAKGIEGVQQAQHTQVERDAILDIDRKLTKLSQDSKELGAEIKTTQKEQSTELTEKVDTLSNTVVDKHLEILEAIDGARRRQEVVMRNLKESVVKNHTQIDERIDGFLDKQFSRYDNAVNFLIKERIYQFIDAKIADQDIFVETPNDNLLKIFAADIVELYELGEDENNGVPDENKGVKTDKL